MAMNALFSGAFGGYGQSLAQAYGGYGQNAGQSVALQPMQYGFQYQPSPLPTYNLSQNYSDSREFTLPQLYNVDRNMFLTNTVNIKPIVNVTDNVFEKVKFNELPATVIYNQPNYYPVKYGAQPGPIQLNFGGAQQYGGYGQSGGYGSYGGYGMPGVPSGYSGQFGGYGQLGGSYQGGGVGMWSPSNYA